MTLDQRLHEASDELLHAVAGHEGAPITSVDRHSHLLRLGAVTAVIVMITVGTGTFALQNSGGSDASPVGTQGPTVTTPSVQDQMAPTTTLPQSSESTSAPTFDGFSVVRRVATTGELIGIRSWSISRSDDGGETWSMIHGEEGQMIEVLDVAPDGTIVAVENRSDIRKGELGPDSVSNDSPKVHMYDPTTGEWRVSVLPRPELPIPDLAPAPRDGTGPCDLGGLQSWVDGVAVTIGEEIVIVGSHAVNGVYFIDGEAVCGRGSQFLWTSSDGLNWTIIPNTGTDTSLTGLVWMGKTYVGYGSPRAAVTGGLPGVGEFEDTESSLELTATTDFSSWVPIELDLSVLPHDVIVNTSPATSGNSGIHMVGPTPSSNDTVAFTFPVLRPRPGPDASISDADALQRWLEEADIGWQYDATFTVEDALDMLDVEFPLDSKDIAVLSSFYTDPMPYEAGRLLVEYTNDGQWTTTYLED